MSLGLLEHFPSIYNLVWSNVDNKYGIIMKCLLQCYTVKK